MKNLFLIFLGAVWISGCGKTLKKSWGDFRAYYNTYYNAANDFRAGIQKVRKQPASLNPAKPVRVHPPPVPAAKEDFEEAISKSVKILRKFPGSKWVDDALLLIGKSYYYQQKFYQALQKFEELQEVSEAKNIKQSAVLWQGRTLLDLKQSRNGISFLEDQLHGHSEKWSKKNLAELQVLLAEHYAMLQNWDQSKYYLSQAVGKLHNKKMLGRAFFLYGQVLQKLERYQEAYQAFSKVTTYFPGFEYMYWAEIKRADVERQQGDFVSALAIYNQLLKDDKFFQRRAEVSFNIARTLEMQRQYLQAEKQYLLLLKKRNDSLSRTSKADIYYRLGKINSTVLGDYNKAAAYFDSSAVGGFAMNARSDYGDAENLAHIFEEYNKLQRTVSHADSLLRLSLLPPSALDSVLAVAHAEKKSEKQPAIDNSRAGTLKNDVDIKNEAGQIAGSGRYGFLNYRNAELVSRQKEAFKIIWGSRPLTDNWRIREIVKNISDESNRPVAKGNQSPALARGRQIEEGVDSLTIREIPRTDLERKQLKVKKQRAQYELGSLLFLRLNDPEKAKYHFYKVIHSKPSKQDLQPRAMYSLYEIYDTEGNEDSLRYWKHRILAEYPHSSFSGKVQPKRNITDSTTQVSSANKLLKLQYRQLISAPHLYRASDLRTMALDHRSSDIAPYIYYQAIKEYIQQAHAFDAISDTWQDKLYDNTADSVYYPEERQFRSIYWDSVRMALAEFDTTFSHTRLHQQVTVLRNTLRSKQLSTCRELGITLQPEPDMQKFLSTVKYPDDLRDKVLSGTVTYSFTVTKAGKIKSYRLRSRKTALGIEEAFERSFSHNLQFAPITARDARDEIRCRISFPIQH